MELSGARSSLQQQLDTAEAQAAAYRKQLHALADVTFHVALQINDDGPATLGAVEVETGTEQNAVAVEQCIRSQDALIPALREAYATGEPVPIALRDGPFNSWTGTVRPCIQACEDESEGPCLSGVLRRTARAARPDMEPLHRELLELLPDAILIVASNDRIKYANSAAVAMMGASCLENLIDTSIWTYLPEEEQQHASRRRQQVRAGRRIDFARHTLCTHQGEERTVESASVPIVHQGRRAALIAVRDLTGRQRLSETVERTLGLFDTAFHLGPAAAIIRLYDGVILEVSERMETLTGFDAAQLAGKHVDHVRTGVPGHRRHQLVRDLLVNRQLHDRELTFTKADGTSCTVLVNARLIALDGDDCALVSLVDITERKQALVQAQETQTLMQKIFRMSPSPLAIVRLDDGTYLNVNDAFCTLIERPRYDIVGRTDDDMVLWSDRSYRKAAFARLNETGTLSDVQTTFRRPDGTRIDVLCAMQRIQIDNRACAVMAITDITQREAARQALVEAKEKAEDVAQFRSSVLSNMTHEMRTPLTVILGFTPTLREAVDPKYRRFIDLIERSGKRLLFTLDSLLDLAQLEAGTLTPSQAVHPLTDLVRTHTASMREKASEKGLTTTIETPEAPVQVHVDPDLLERVLHHVVDNAIKFTEQGSIAIRLTTEGNDAIIQVEDTGAGIDPAFVPRAFKAFAQESEGLARTHQGSGLGLTVCKHVMERLGGSIDIGTAKGKGSIITLRLPLASPAQDDAARS
jgi:PAS domain S-box-containing protein